MLRYKTRMTFFRTPLFICLAIVLLVAQTGCTASNAIDSSAQQSFVQREDVVCNPLIGFAPSADDPEEVGDNSLVFVLLTWRDWEPEKDHYDVEGLEQKFNLAQWRDSKKQVVLRFVCDVPGEDFHKDIPEWLYEEMNGDGDSYDISYGKGFSPNYTNEYFIERHSQAIEALGDYFGQDSFIAYVELGSVGHWGEWHTDSDASIAPIPDEDICSQYVKPYLTAFPNAKLLMRRPFLWVSEHNMGVYNDMTGSVEDTKEWLDWINNGGIYEESATHQKLKAVPDIWETNPVGGEFTSSLAMGQMLGSDLGATVALIEASHMSFLGPKIPLESDGVSAESIDAVSRSLGYRYSILESNIYAEESGLGFDSGQVIISLDWENSGTAPLYWNWPTYIYLLDDENNVLHKQPVDIDLTTLTGDNNTLTTETVIDRDDLSEGTFRVGVGIEDPQTDTPSVTLAMECETVDKIHLIGWFTN